MGGRRSTRPKPNPPRLERPNHRRQADRRSSARPDPAAEAAEPGARCVPALDRSRKPSRFGKQSRDTAARRRPSPRYRSRPAPKRRPPVPHVGMSSPAASRRSTRLRSPRSIDRSTELPPAESVGPSGSARLRVATHRFAAPVPVFVLSDVTLTGFLEAASRFPKKPENSPLELHFSLGVRTFSARLPRSRSLRSAASSNELLS